MSYLIGSGWWILWYGLLWLAVAPFVAMTAALARATPNDPVPPMENAFAVGSVGLFVLIVGFAFIFGAGYYAVTPKLPMTNRWAAQLVCLASAGLLLWVCLHATWRFRHR